jgi:hypothetical protein
MIDHNNHPTQSPWQPETTVTINRRKERSHEQQLHQNNNTDYHKLPETSTTTMPITIQSTTFDATHHHRPSDNPMETATMKLTDDTISEKIETTTTTTTNSSLTDGEIIHTVNSTTITTTEAQNPTQLPTSTSSIPSSEANPCETNEPGLDCNGGSTPQTDDQLTTNSDVSLPTENLILTKSVEESTFSTTQVVVTMMSPENTQTTTTIQSTSTLTPNGDQFNPSSPQTFEQKPTIQPSNEDTTKNTKFPSTNPPKPILALSNPQTNESSINPRPDLLLNSQNITKIEEPDSEEDDAKMETLTKDKQQEEESEEVKRQKYKKLSWRDRFAKFIKVVKEYVSKVNPFERANNNNLG